MEHLTFEKLPEAVTQILDIVLSIKRQIDNQPTKPIEEQPIWFNLKGVCEYLPDKPAKATVYGWVHSREIPFHKDKKKLRFSKTQIDQWLENGKRKTVAELATEADDYLLKNKGGKAL